MPVLTEELAHLRRDPSGETGHRWQISCSEFSPDGSLLASGSWDKEVRIWDLSSLETKLRLKGVHDVPITSLSWHKPRGGLLCVGSADCTASLWDSQKGAHLASLTDHDGWVLDVSFSSNGKLLATASWDSNVRLWDSVTQSLIGKLAGHEKGVWCTDFKPVKGSTVLCSGSEDGQIILWDARTNRAERKFDGGHSKAVYCVCWSPDGATIASGSEDTKVCIWEPGSGTVINTIQSHTSTVKSVAFNPQMVNVSHPLLASAGDFFIHLSDPRPAHKANILSLFPHETGKEIETVSISPDGSLIASGGRDGMVVLMTLMVPRLLPISTSFSKKAREKKKKNRKFIKDAVLTHGSEDEEEVLDEIDELEDILTKPPETQHNVSRLKRISRVKVKDVELDDHATVRKQYSAKTSRGKRVKEKNIDIPTMVAHLSGTPRVYGNHYEGISDEEKQPVKVQPSGGGLLQRIAKLKTEQENALKEEKEMELEEEKRKVETKEVKKGKEDDTFEDLTDPEVHFLQGRGLPHSSTMNSSMNTNIDDQYTLFSTLDTTTIFEEEKQGKKRHKPKMIDSIPEAAPSMSAISIGSEVLLEIEGVEEQHEDNEEEEALFSEEEDDMISVI